MATAVVAAALAAQAGAFDVAAEARNYVKGAERFAHDEPDPGFQAEIALQSLEGSVDLARALADDPARLPANPCAATLDLCAGDPRLYDWPGRFGVVRPIHYVNRNGAVISGHLWAPLPARGARVRRMPAVVIVNGDLAPEQVYWWAAEVLARAGYVVMTFDPQGHGASDTLGTGTTRLRHVAVQQVAGTDAVNAPADQDAAEQVRDALAFLESGPRQPYVPPAVAGFARGTSPAGAKQRSLAASGDADRFDPLRRLVDARRIGLAGHSRGADAVSIVGSRDPRVDAIVAWDNLLARSGGSALTPRVPALGMSADYYEYDPPYTSDPPPDAKLQGFRSYRRAGVDTMEVVVRGGTHFEWSYVPSPAFGEATLRGIDMAAWYTQAWFDRYLKHRPGAIRRIETARWRHDRAEAGVDLAGDGNLYSYHYRSAMAIHGGGGAAVDCPTLRTGCSALVPRARDGYRGRYSYLSARRR